MTVDELLQKPYWIIDILPKLVSKDSNGQYFEIEKYYLQKDELTIIKKKHLNILLKINCYKDIKVDQLDLINPKPAILAKAINEKYLSIIIDNSLIISEPDDTHLSIFNPSDELLELIKALCQQEGLFLWR